MEKIKSFIVKIEMTTNTTVALVYDTNNVEITGFEYLKTTQIAAIKRATDLILTIKNNPKTYPSSYKRLFING